MKLPKVAIALVLLGPVASVGLAAGRHSSGEPTPAQVASLVRNLDDNQFMVREQAENSLRELGTSPVARTSLAWRQARWAAWNASTSRRVPASWTRSRSLPQPPPG